MLQISSQSDTRDDLEISVQGTYRLPVRAVILEVSEIHESADTKATHILMVVSSRLLSTVLVLFVSWTYCLNVFSGVNDVSVGHLPRVISILIRFTYLLKSHQWSSSLQDNRDIIQDSAVF